MQRANNSHPNGTGTSVANIHWGCDNGPCLTSATNIFTPPIPRILLWLVGSNPSGYGTEPCLLPGQLQFSLYPGINLLLGHTEGNVYVAFVADVFRPEGRLSVLVVLWCRVAFHSVTVTWVSEDRSSRWLGTAKQRTQFRHSLSLDHILSGKVGLISSPAGAIPVGSFVTKSGHSLFQCCQCPVSASAGFLFARFEIRVFCRLLFPAVSRPQATGNVPHDQEHDHDHQQQTQRTTGSRLSVLSRMAAATSCWTNPSWISQETICRSPSATSNK